MSRLGYIAGRELAIQTILDELSGLEMRVSSGEQLTAQDLDDLGNCLRRLDCLVKKAGQQSIQRWEADSEPYPDWLQPKPVANTSRDEQMAKKV